MSLNIRPKYDEAASIRVAGGISGLRNGNARIASQEVSCNRAQYARMLTYFAGFSDAAMALAPAASSLSYCTSTMQTLSPAGTAR